MKDVRLRYEHIRKRERRAQSEKTTDEATASESELEECLVPDAARHSSESDDERAEAAPEAVEEGIGRTSVLIAASYVKQQFKYKPQNHRTAKPRVRAYGVRLTP